MRLSVTMATEHSQIIQSSRQQVFGISKVMNLKVLFVSAYRATMMSIGKC